MTRSHWMGPILGGWNKQATTGIVILKGFLLQNRAVFGLSFYDDPCRWWFQRFFCWFTPITKAAYITKGFFTGYLVIRGMGWNDTTALMIQELNQLIDVFVTQYFWKSLHVDTQHPILSNPEDPWDWYIYLHFPSNSTIHVGKYISLMDPQGKFANFLPNSRFSFRWVLTSAKPWFSVNMHSFLIHSKGLGDVHTISCLYISI